MYYKGINLKKYRKSGTYLLKDTSRKNLEANDFHFKRSMSDADETIYEHIIPVYRYHASVLLEARFLLIHETGEVRVDVFDSATKGVYAPWYREDSIHSKINQIIDMNITKEMNKLGMIELKEDENATGN